MARDAQSGLRSGGAAAVLSRAGLFVQELKWLRGDDSFAPDMLRFAQCDSKVCDMQVKRPYTLCFGYTSPYSNRAQALLGVCLHPSSFFSLLFIFNIDVIVAAF